MAAGLSGTVSELSAGGEACLEVRNEAPFWVPGHVEGAARKPLSFRLEAGESERLCPEGPPLPGEELRLLVKNALGLAIVDCRAPSGRTVTITATEEDEGWRVAASCR